MNVLPATWAWLTTADHWSGTGGVWHRLAEHLYLTGASLLVAGLLALPLALWLGHTPVRGAGRGRARRIGGSLAVNISNAGRAIPTFAVLVLLMLTPVSQVDTLPVLIALVLFALPPLLTNAYVGVAHTDPDVVEAARGLGMSSGQLMLRVELPLAFPLIMTGVRTAAVQVVATATLAAMVGGGGLGRIITAGFANQRTAQVVAGALLVALLALLVEAVFALAQRLLDPSPRTPRRRGGKPRADGGTPGNALSGTGAGALPTGPEPAAAGGDAAVLSSGRKEPVS